MVKALDGSKYAEACPMRTEALLFREHSSGPMEMDLGHNFHGRWQTRRSQQKSKQRVPYLGITSLSLDGS